MTSEADHELKAFSRRQLAQAALGSIEPSVHENMKLIDHLWSQSPAARCALLPDEQVGNGTKEQIIGLQ